MKFELNDKTGKHFSVALSEINDEKLVAGKKKKKEELRDIGFTFNTNAERHYWLEEYPEDTLNITITVDGTMVATKKNGAEINATDQQKIDTVVKKMYALLGVTEAEYKLVAETKGIGTSSASPLPSTAAPAAKNYHSHLTDQAAALNTALNPYHYQVNTANNTLEKLDNDNKTTGHKITINKDGSTKGDLFQDLSNADTVAQLISEDHIAVINMHLALLKQGIKPDKKINLVLIKQGLSAEQAKLITEIEEKIKSRLADELAKPEYNDIKEYIVYEGLPLTVKKETAKEASQAEKKKDEAGAENGSEAKSDAPASSGPKGKEENNPIDNAEMGSPRPLGVKK